jgi:hypothetical protein
MRTKTDIDNKAPILARPIIHKIDDKAPILESSPTSSTSLPMTLVLGLCVLVANDSLAVWIGLGWVLRRLFR